MSNFEIAYEITERFEGLYSNDLDDSGGETFKGISRKKNPYWEGWKTVDSLKSNGTFPEILETSGVLMTSVKRFYKTNYFDVFRGDTLPEDLAIEMYDTAVNQGRKRAITYLQESLNLLNRNNKIYQDMKVDGLYGSITHERLGQYLKKDSLDRLLTVMNIMQGARYIELMKANPTQEKWVGWFNRVSLRRRSV